MTIQQEIDQCRKTVAEIQRQEERRVALLEHAMARLKELGFDTVEAAEAEVRRLELEVQELENQAQALLHNIKQELSNGK